MSATEILNLPLATTVTGEDLVEIVQAGVAKKVNISELFESPANLTDGLSAYQIAVENGFVGSEQEWLASLVGATGQRGPAGANGLHGPQGLKGDQGPAGPQGLRGRVGDTGRAGFPGVKGDQGIQGIPGISAYDVAVLAGYQGTQQQWLVSLKGLKGDTGDQGIQGVQGNTGPQGPQGEQGETGPAVSLAPTEFRQSAPSAVWTVNHNLGYRPGSVKVLSEGGVEMMVEIIHANSNQVLVYFDQPTTGFVLYI